MQGTIKEIDGNKVTVEGNGREYHFRPDRFTYSGIAEGDTVSVKKDSAGETKISLIEHAGYDDEDDEDVQNGSYDDEEYDNSRQVPADYQYEDTDISDDALHNREILGLVLTFIPEIITLVISMIISIGTSSKLKERGKNRTVAKIGIILAVLRLAATLFLCLGLGFLIKNYGSSLSSLKSLLGSGQQTRQETEFQESTDDGSSYDTGDYTESSSTESTSDDTDTSSTSQTDSDNDELENKAEEVLNDDGSISTYETLDDTDTTEN